MPLDTFRSSSILLQFFQTLGFPRHSSNSVDCPGFPELLPKYDLNLLISLAPCIFSTFQIFLTIFLQFAPVYFFPDRSRISHRILTVVRSSLMFVTSLESPPNFPNIIFLSLFRSSLLSAIFQALSQFSIFHPRGRFNFYHSPPLISCAGNWFADRNEWPSRTQ